MPAQAVAALATSAKTIATWLHVIEARPQLIDVPTRQDVKRCSLIARLACPVSTSFAAGFEIGFLANGARAACYLQMLDRQIPCIGSCCQSAFNQHAAALR